ncbi:NUDIX domain-containing protein [Streptomyces sp. PU-14G]|uniref:NUDIX domain-containing protein n=1 Tax=Streptomyces sp. PU-14G TaxID=2800808 RepID=UPI0034DEEC0A
MTQRQGQARSDHGRSPTGQTHCSDDGPRAPSSFGREPAILIAVGEPLTHRFLRLTGQKSTNPLASPGGRVETSESAPEASVRELAEETGLSARLDDAYLLTLLHDDRDGVRRVSAVVRVTAWTGAPRVCEPHRFTRWEWHPLHTLAGLGPIFAPSAQALEATWPGVLSGLPPVHSYPQADAPPAIGGEPPRPFGCVRR